jgi:uncharacterized protein YdhG (YjbR/CyaY superfamily)
MPKPSTPDAYIATFPEEIQERLQRVRTTIRKAAPGADEAISYGIVGYKQDGVLIHFAGFARHIGLYPITAGVKDELAGELAAFKTTKGGVQLPHDQRLPVGLVRRIVKLRVQENQAKLAAKKAKR